MIKLMIAGACGRMATRIMALASQDRKFKIAGAFEGPSHPGLGIEVAALLGIDGIDVTVQSSVDEVVDAGDVLIDFPQPNATLKHILACEKAKKGIVIGTTGLPKKVQQAMQKASKKIPIVQAPNMSAGVNLLFSLVELVASRLGEGYDIEIVEAHHRYKKDAPSGTALQLAEQAASGRKKKLDQIAVYGRKGMTGERERGSIGVHALRGGDVVGDHTVSFMADGERIELTHKASSRDCFAKGALLAAEFAAKKKKGLFTMQDVLGL